VNTILKSALAVTAVAISAQAAAEITFYQNENFQGRAFTMKQQVKNFKSIGFNDRASSVVAVRDRWEVCEDIQFRGRCVVLRPGRYTSLTAMGLNDRVSSVRMIARNARIDESRYAPAATALYDGRRRNNEQLYQAKVTSVRAVVGPPTQQCWVERSEVPQAQTGNDLPSALAAILGYQTGAATQPVYQDVQRCASVPSQRPDHWDVTYNFRGQDHRIQTIAAPGSTITVNRKGEPRA
jgi:hypothetical protein